MKVYSGGVFAGVIWRENGRWFAELPSGELLGDWQTEAGARLALTALAGRRAA